MNNKQQTLPAAPDMERSLISCIMQTADAFGQVRQPLVAEDFSVEAHGILWELVVREVQQGRPVDLVSFMQLLTDRGVLEKIGGAGYLSEVFTAATNPAQAGHFARVVGEQSRRRKLVRACWDTAQQVIDHGAPEEADFKALVESLEGELMAIMRTAQHSRKGLRSGADVVIGVVDTAKARYAQRGQPLGLTLGFPDLDRIMNGLQPGDFCVVAARPAMGKTSLATAFAEAIAADACNRRNRPVLMFTLEMSDEQIMERSLMGRARLALSKSRTGMFSDAEGAVMRVAGEVIRKHRGADRETLYAELACESSEHLQSYWKYKTEKKGFEITKGKLEDAIEQIKQVSGAIATIATSDLTFYDGYGVTTAEIRAEIRKWVKKIGWTPGSDLCPPLVIVDYLQLVKASEKKAKGDPRLTIVEVCEVLKGVAKEFGIAVMPLAQVGRGSEENAGKMPMLKDLKESGAIEEYADYVIFIHRPSYYRKWEAVQEKDQEYWENMAKRRNDSDVRVKLQEDAWSGQSFYEAHALLGIRKGRHCATADVEILFRGDLARFSTKTPALFSNNSDHRQQKPAVPRHEDEFFD